VGLKNPWSESAQVIVCARSVAVDAFVLLH